MSVKCLCCKVGLVWVRGSVASLISLYCHTTMQSGPISHVWYLYNFLPFRCHCAAHIRWCRACEFTQGWVITAETELYGLWMRVLLTLFTTHGWLKVHLDGSDLSLHVPCCHYCKNISTHSLGFNPTKWRGGVGVVLQRDEGWRRSWSPQWVQVQSSLFALPD